MRLTLRTLLAYLDGNLEPDDSQDIGKKIEESEFATKLVHLIRDCTRRLRLDAPELIGRGLGADPNTVAEYLEYRLADERVPEFERICLESEVHLAEVAGCHQILTLVLGEPAEIENSTRQRLYALAAHADAPPPQSDAVQPSSAAGVAPQTAAALPPSTQSLAPQSAAIPPAPPARRPKPEVPDYLRGSRWSWWPVAALVLIAATLTFAGLLVFAPQLRQRVAGLMGAEQAAPDEAASDEAAADQADDAASDQNQAPPAPAEPAADDTAPPAPDDADARPVPDEVGEPAMPDATPPTDVPAEAAPETATETARPAPLPPEPDETALPGRLPGDLPADAPREAMPDEPAPLEAAGEPGGPAAPLPVEAAPPREPAGGFGRFTSKFEVLLEFDPATKSWLRLPANAPLDAGDELLAPPSFRPTITLRSNITIQADGDARFTLEGWTDDGVPIIALDYGRLLMLTIGKADNSLLLKIDGYEPLLTFVDAESTLAIEVRRELPPGTDPENGPAPLVANLYATSGLIRVQNPGDDAPAELQAPAECSLVASPIVPIAGMKFPAWVTSDEQSDFDRLSTGQIDGYLTTATPAGLQLRELSDPAHKLGRRREVRTLAMLCLMSLGDFDPVVTAMNNENERLFWPIAIDALRTAVARSPQTAGQVRTAFEKQRGPAEGMGLYRTLWGYSQADLKNGADRDLVEGLINNSLDVRVMCFLTLKDLTGTGATHGYRPDDQEIIRNQKYNTWKKQIGKIGQRPGGS